MNWWSCQPHRFSATLVGALFVLSSAYAGAGPWANATIRFATQEEGASLLGTKDDFITRLSSFDRSARMRSELDVSEDEFLQFVESATLPWTDQEKAALQDAFTSIAGTLDQLNVPALPDGFQFIKTTGNEEGNSAYTRGNAIILPVAELNAGSDELNWLVSHELFHLISRHFPALRDKLYETIGFTRGEEYKFPPQLESRRITNPDGIWNSHFIRLRVGPTAICAIPILLSDQEHYDKQRGGQFFDYLQFKLLVTRLPYKNDDIAADRKLIDLDGRVAGFVEQVGKNTDYVIHPDEILADNFALLVTQKYKPRSPEILKMMTNAFAKFDPSDSRKTETKSTTPDTCQR